MAGTFPDELAVSSDGWSAAVLKSRVGGDAANYSFVEDFMRLPCQACEGTSRRRGNLSSRLLDIAVIAFGASFASRFEASGSQPGYDSALVAFALLGSVFLFPAFGLYRVAHRHSFWHCVCVPTLAWIIALAAALLFAIASLEPYRPSGDWVARWALFSGLGLVVCRFVERARSVRRVERAARTRAVAIVGSGAHCRHLLRKVEAAKDSTYLVATIFDTGPATGVAPGIVPAFRDREGFAGFVRRHHVEEIWLALPVSEEKTILDFIELFRNDLLNIRFIPDVSGLALFEGEVIDLDGTSAINLVGSPLSSDALVAKDIFDRVFALAAVTVLMPLLLIIAIAVKLSSPGPALFTQRRKGANGKVFNIYKFRSMRLHAAARGVVEQATRNDPRITRVGAFLRRTSLDELPQFFNVLRGEMSVVGPRPHAIEHDALYQNIVDGYIHRYRIKPGITGWAQVNGFRGETDRIEKMRGRVEHDLYYLSNWSFWLDMRIVFATVFKGLVHRNAY